jgi:hypothetical protein
MRRWVWQDLFVLLRTRLGGLAARWPMVERLVAWGSVTIKVGLWGIVAVAGLLAAAGAWRAVGSRAAPRAPRDALDDIYRQMCAALSRRGLRRGPAETVDEFRRRVESGGALPEVSAISGMVEAAAYGGADPDPDTMRTARDHLDGLRSRLRRLRG